jgi:hypothetical protein
LAWGKSDRLVNTPREDEVSCFLLWLDMDELLGGRRDQFPRRPVRFLQALAARGSAVKYEKVDRVLREGDFVLVVSEGTFGDRPQLNGRKHAGNPVDRHQTPVRQSR